MKILFKTKKIATICNNNKTLKQLGEYRAKGLSKRLAQLYSADKLEDFKFDKPHPFKGR